MAAPSKDDDLDNTLLMLATGGAESGEEIEDSGDDSDSSRSRSRFRSPSHTPQKRSSRSRSPRRVSRSRSPYRSLNSVHSLPQFNPTPLHHSSDKTASSGKMSRPRNPDDQKEEGEASDVPGSPHSLGSSAMDESFSDAEDDDDAAGLNATTIEREMALAEAAEKENEKKKMAQLKQLFPHATGLELSGLSAKRKLGIGDFELPESPRRSTRPRTKQDEALETLKSIREANRREEQLRREGRLPPPVPSRRSPVSSRFDAEEGLAPEPAPDLPGSFQEFQRVRVSRTNFGKFGFYPGFAEAITGCFARVVFNQDPVTGENMYRMVRIAGFTQGKPYKFEDFDNRAHMTDQYLIAAYGNNEKEYPFAVCSDSKFTEAEFERWKLNMGTSGMEIHKGSYLRAKVVDIDGLCSRSWTAKEIQEKIDRQNKHRHLFRPTQRSAVGPETLERDDALHRRNMESRRRNEEQVRRALLTERRNRARRAAVKRKEEEAKKAEEEGKANGVAGGKAEVSKPAPISIYVPRERGSLTSMTRLKTDDEIIASIDFDIDMDI